jgi:hydroxymethylpyrimidine pyrophosphatase-like HAD family hydrolase
MTSPPQLSEDPRATAALARARIMYTDLDGTMLGRGGSLLNDHEGEPTLAMAEATVELNQAGLPVIIVSGRNDLQLVEITRMLGWTGFIAEVGAVFVRERGAEITFNLGDWPDDALPAGRTPYQVIEASGAAERLMRRFPGLIEYHDPFHKNRLATHVLRGNVDVAAAQLVVDEDGDHPPIDIVDNGIIHPWRHTLVGVEQIHIYHLLPRGVNKAQAVAEDRSVRGIGRDEAIAVGDSVADLKMAEAVGLMALVANGLDSSTTREAASALDNVVMTRLRQGHGWAEVAHAWLAARSKR